MSSLEQLSLFAGNHAIEAVVFAISFREPLSQSDYRRFGERIEDLRKSFPSIEPLQGVKVEFGPQSTGFTADNNARQLAEFGRDGKQIWSANFMESTINVTCHRYDGWSDVSKQAAQRLGDLLDCVDSKKAVAAIDLVFVNTFISEHTQFGITPRVVFRAPNKHIPEAMFQHEDPRWDVKQGWFEQIDAGSLLTRLDCQSFIRNQNCICNIQNTHSLRSGSSERPLENARKYMEETFDDFHDRNVDILRGLLSHELLKRMQLEK